MITIVIMTQIMYLNTTNHLLKDKLTLFKGFTRSITVTVYTYHILTLTAAAYTGVFDRLELIASVD